MAMIPPVARTLDRIGRFARNPRRTLSDRRIRKSRAVVVSFPKSGRTWLRKILLDLDVKMPFTHDTVEDVIRNGRGHAAPPDPARFADRSVMLLIRDPRDVVVSFHHDLTKRYGRFEGTLSDMIREPDIGIEAIINFNMKYFAQRDLFRQFHLCRYEEMVADTPRAVGAALSAFGFRWISAQRIAQCCAASTFDAMKKAEESGALAKRYSANWFADPQSATTARKVRKGRSGGFVEEMSADDVAYCAQALRARGYPEEWLAVPLD